jgi:excinuclease UvrABC nuclease subunit
MISEKITSVPTNTAGVYCLFDLDGTAAYAGKSSDLRTRLRQHFIRQDSSAASYGRLNLWDIWFLQWWETEDQYEAEQALLAEYQPYLNFDAEFEKAQAESPIRTDEPDGRIELMTEEEAEFRSQPYNRSKQKLEHISRILDKIK